MKLGKGQLINDDEWVGQTFELIPEKPNAKPFNFSFSVSENYAHWLTDRMEGAVLAALFPAMALGENIEVDVPVSAKFHYMLRQVMKYFRLWYPNKLSMIDIESNGTDAAESSGEATLACFSGGVDSFYTLHHHSAATEPIKSYRMTHGLFVHGFDIPTSNTPLYDTLADQYEKLLNNQGVELVRCRTNIREYVDTFADWMTTHGVALNMTAHMLSAGINNFIIPSTNRFSLINPPIGSNPITDPQPSTESFEIIHHGCEASRIEKIMAIADWPAVQHNLRVCFQETDQSMNCGTCKKCQKVMLPLWVTGKLDAFSCFPAGFDPQDIDHRLFEGFELHRYAPETTYGEQITELAKQHNPDALATIPLPSTANSNGWAGKLRRIFRRI